MIHYYLAPHNYYDTTELALTLTLTLTLTHTLLSVKRKAAQQWVYLGVRVEHNPADKPFIITYIKILIYTISTVY